MNLIKCEKLEKSMAELQFSIDAEAFKKAVADVFKKEGKKYPVQGFRKGKFWILLAIAGGFIVLNLITFYAMDALLRMEGLEEMAGMEQMAAMFAKTFRNGVMYYVQYLNTYYLLVVIFLFMGCCSKEIKSRQWLLPVSSDAYCCSRRINESFCSALPVSVTYR